MSEKKLLADLVQELVDVAYALEKKKYSRPERVHGWVKASFILAYGAEAGFGKRQLAHNLQRAIDETNQEMSDLYGKVEL
jgi:hypothetical protein